MPNRYSYASAGFDNFFKRSIDSFQASAANLNEASTFATRGQNQELNFDQAQTRGALGDVLQVGTRVIIDGSTGRVSVNDQNGNEVVRLGDLGD